MPYITVESGLMTAEQKDKLIKRLTEISAEITNIPKEFFIVTIKELPDSNIGIGGKSIDKIKKEYIRKESDV